MATVSQEERPNLMANALSLGADWVASVATVAPSSSVAFTLALLVSFSGLASPLAVVVAGFLMIFVAVGYARFNKWKPHAGAPFVWVGHAVGPIIGYATGILAILAATVANIGNITLAGTYLLGLINPGGTFPGIVVWLISSLIMVAVVFLAIRGIRPSIWVQTAIIAFEYTIVVLFVILALYHEIAVHPAGTHVPSLSYFAFGSSPSGLSGLANAIVICGFLYAGWEAPLVLSEESEKPHFNPGRAALLGLGFLTVWYTFLILVFQGIASPKDIQAHGSDILAYTGTILLPQPWSRLLPLAVFSAVFGTTQMQLTESSRVVFAMGRDRLLPSSLSAVQHAFRTPWMAALVLGAIPTIALIPYLASSAATTAIGYIISADGLLYLCMYFVIALTCVWYFRRVLAENTQELLLNGLLPLVGGLAMVAVFFYGLHSQIPQVSVVGGAIVVLCLVWAIAARFMSRSRYFESAHNVYDALSDPEAEKEPTPVS